MKKIIHQINLSWSILQVLACVVFIGFYTLPLFGIFQTILMLYSISYYPRFERKEKSLFHIYWIGYVLFFAFLYLLNQVEPINEDPFIVLMVLFMAALAGICVRFTHLITQPK